MTPRPMGALVGLLLAQGAAAQAPRSYQDPSPAPSLSNPLTAQPLERLTQTRDRPLFTPGRRPPAEAPPPPPPVVAEAPEEAPPAPPPSLVLAGVVVDQSGPRAVVRDEAANKTVSLRIGDAVGAWRVRRIEPRLLVIGLDDRSAEFGLFRSDKPAGAGRRGRPPVASDDD
jgi:hypothetical protein